MLGSEVLVDGHTGGGRNTLGMTKVLHRDRNAMQGTTNCAPGDLGVSLPCLSQRQIAR
jgi:hypothetical protein